MKITFIEHSGFMVEMERTVLLFDYYQGEIPAFDKEKTLYVFVSHSHADHYNPVIWKLKEQYEKVQYIISDDVKTKEYIKSNYYLYISKSKNGSQYLDSLYGEASVSDSGDYSSNIFLLENKDQEVAA